MRTSEALSFILLNHRKDLKLVSNCVVVESTIDSNTKLSSVSPKYLAAKYLPAREKDCMAMKETVRNNNSGTIEPS